MTDSVVETDKLEVEDSALAVNRLSSFSNFTKQKEQNMRKYLQQDYGPNHLRRFSEIHEIPKH